MLEFDKKLVLQTLKKGYLIVEDEHLTHAGMVLGCNLMRQGTPIPEGVNSCDELASLLVSTIYLPIPTLEWTPAPWGEQ